MVDAGAKTAATPAELADSVETVITIITNAEAIVVRDDNWGTGATPFSALTDPSDMLAGRRVATALSFPFNQTGVAAKGQERWGGDISIAVDPRNSSTVCSPGRGAWRCSANPWRDILTGEAS